MYQVMKGTVLTEIADDNATNTGQTSTSHSSYSSCRDQGFHRWRKAASDGSDAYSKKFASAISRHGVHR